MNSIIITGRLTADPELKTTPNGNNVTQFTVAVDRAYKSGGEKQTDFFRVIAWRNTADFICRYFSKGKPILIEGEMNNRQYTDKDGNKRDWWEIKADKVEFMGDKPADNSAANAATAAQNASPSATVSADFSPEATDDDYPF